MARANGKEAAWGRATMRRLATATFVLVLCWSEIRSFSKLIDVSEACGKPEAGGYPEAGGDVKPEAGGDVFRFPSREERLRYYMGDWYNVTGNHTRRAGWNATSLCADIPFFESKNYGSRPHDIAFIFDSVNVRSFGMWDYRRDMKKYLFPSSSNKLGCQGSSERLIISAGDDSVQASLQYPVILKARDVVSHEGQGDGKKRMTPILAMLNTQRHYNPVKTLWKGLGRLLSYDRPWELKKTQLIWRGGKTGGTKREKMIGMFLSENNGTFPPTTGISGIPMNVKFGFLVPMRQLLLSKYLLSLEGNDVGSGLKWMLYSNSVVFMPPPTKVSWAMEDRLVPYVHYVPVLANLTDLPSKLEWAHQNDRRVREISRQATLYIENLFASQQAESDNIWIHRQILKRYQNQFGQDLKKCPPVSESEEK